MKISLLVIGKTDHAQLEQLITTYAKRLEHYVGFDLEVIPDLKNTKKLSEAQQKEKEGTAILAKLQPSDHVVVLDERGKQFSSINFASYLQKKMNTGMKRLVFIIGGPYGFSDEVYARAQEKVALSQMTFSHQMVRLFMVEQLYRGFTILKNEPYHHQ